MITSLLDALAGPAGSIAQSKPPAAIDPVPRPAITGAPGVEMAALMLPGAAGPGDLYDTFRMSDDLLSLLVADTWVDGAVPVDLRAFCRETVRDLCLTERTPGGVLTHLNRRLIDRPFQGTLVGIFLAWLDLRTGQVLHANAGNPRAVRVAPGSPARPCGEVTGPALGVVDIPILTGADVRLAPGETIVLCTDGVVAPRARPGRTLDPGSLRTIIETHAADPLHALCAGIARALLPSPPARREEDATLLSVRWQGPPILRRHGSPADRPGARPG